MAKTIHLVGIGYKPLNKETENLLKGISKIFAFKGTIKIFENYSVAKEVKNLIQVVEKLDELIQRIKEEDKEVAVLASGDPLFFGIGEKLLEVFPRDSIKVYPDLTTPQVLCSRLKIPFYKVKVFSLHGRSLNLKNFLREVSENPYLFVYTDKEQDPSFIAKLLCEEAFEGVILHIGERLQSPEERVISGSPKEFLDKVFHYPHCILIENRKWGKEPKLGFRESEILHDKGMITKDEVRAIILHKLRPPLRGVIWDIGAGSGSISLELARLSPYLEVYAIEKKEEYCKIIEKNSQRLRLPNVRVVYGEASQVLKTLPEPDRVFVGGSSGRLQEILLFLETLKKTEIFVFSFITLENLYETYNFYKEKGIEPEILQVQVNRLRPLGGFLGFKAENPIFLLVVSKV